MRFWVVEAKKQPNIEKQKAGIANSTMKSLCIFHMASISPELEKFFTNIHHFSEKIYFFDNLNFYLYITNTYDACKHLLQWTIMRRLDFGKWHPLYCTLQYIFFPARLCKLVEMLQRFAQIFFHLKSLSIGQHTCIYI